MGKNANEEHENFCYGAEKMWKALSKSCKEVNEDMENIGKGNKIVLVDEKQLEFKTKFCDYYKDMMEDFMTGDTKSLDAHKQAAILVKAAIDSGVLKQDSGENEVALGPYAVILNVAFSYLLQCIDERAKKIGVSVSRMELPIALACETPYFEILCRILYYEDTRKGASGEKVMPINLLDWADRFYLLEYITLLQNKLDPILFQDKFWEIGETTSS